MRAQKIVPGIFLGLFAIAVSSWEIRAQPGPVFSCQVSSHPTALTGSLVPSVPTVGTNKLIYFRARFPDDTSDPVSVEEAEQTLAQVDEVFGRISYGKFRLKWKVSDIVHLRKSREEYSSPSGFNEFLEDVRQAAMSHGDDYRDYDFDVVRHSGVPGFMGGNANLGSRGAQVQAPGAILLVHELGHNLGLSHANLWTTGSPGISRGSPPLPSNYETLPDPRSTPIYPDSALGHETITGPGSSSEYGDARDVMGSGSAEFSAVYRAQLGWLPWDEVADALEGSSTHRIQGTDSALTGLPRALRAGRPFNSTSSGLRQYWIQIPAVETNALETAGVQLRWADLDSGPSLLVAPLASAPAANGGVILPPGKTFSDPLAGVHVTVVDFEGEGASRYADVAVVNGNDTANRVPFATLNAGALSAAVDEPVALSALASDPDGDLLAWHWDFGDGSTSFTATEVTKSWRRTGDFVVLLEVSDRKGGVARAHTVIRVGQPRTRRITGRIIDAQGDPVAGVRVHNGIHGPVVADRRHVFTFSDSQGRYTLAGLAPGSYTNGAFHPSYSIARRPRITVGEGDIGEVDFVATSLSQVTVAAAGEVPESIGITNLFTFTRIGPTNEALTVHFQVGGTATAGVDYARPLIDRVVIPAGAVSSTLLLDIFDDQVGDPGETIVLDVVYPPLMTRLDGEGNPYTVYYPGWDAALIDGQINWVLTEPSYVPGPARSATVVIADNDAASPHVVSVRADDIFGIEEPPVETSFTVSRYGQVDRSLTVFLELSGTAENGVDYVRVPDSLTFEPAQTEFLVLVKPIADDVPEGEEEVVLRIMPDAAYGIELATATVRIRDSGGVPQILTLKPLLNGTLELVMKAQAGSRLVLESSLDLGQWLPVRTNFFFNTDSVAMPLPPTNPATFYRTVRQ